jgi:hypothetical protein
LLCCFVALLCYFKFKTKTIIFSSFHKTNKLYFMIQRCIFLIYFRYRSFRFDCLIIFHDNIMWCYSMTCLNIYWCFWNNFYSKNEINDEKIVTQIVLFSFELEGSIFVLLEKAINVLKSICSFYSQTCVQQPPGPWDLKKCLFDRGAW